MRQGYTVRDRDLISAAVTVCQCNRYTRPIATTPLSFFARSIFFGALPDETFTSPQPSVMSCSAVL